MISWIQKYPLLFALAVASKFFMFLSVCFLGAAIFNNVWRLPAIICGSCWTLTLFSVMFVGVRTWIKESNENSMERLPEKRS